MVHHVIISRPAPLVNAVYPQSGPIAGGTPLTLIGNNLGTSLEDIVNVTVASVLCDTVEYISISELHCVTGRVLPQNLKKHADKPVVGPIVVTTVSGGRGDRFHDVRANANFTYNPPPVVTSVFPDEIYSTYATEVSIGGSNLGMSKEDIESVLIANHSRWWYIEMIALMYGMAILTPSIRIACSLLHFIDPTSIICMWNHTLLSPTTTGRVLVKTKSGGSCISSNTSVTIRPGCSRAKDTQACALMECTWCSVTASCANDRDNCPAVCLRHGSRSSCERQSALDGCRWCATTAACLDGSDDCPRGCFLHRTQEACTATSALQDDQQCGWCPSTMACLDVAELSACPSDCSLAAGTHFSCGSLIILVMMTILVVVIGTGFWTVVYYVQRDEQLTNDLKRYARTLRPSSWLTSRQQEMGRSGSGVGGETDAGAMADDSQPLLNDSPELIHRRAPRPPLSPFSAYQRGKPTHGGAPFPSSTRRIAIGQHRIASPLIRASTPTSDTEDETQHAGVFNAAVDDITSLQDEPLLQPPSDHVDTQTTTATTAASKLASFFSRRDSVPPGTPPREDETEPPVRPSLNSTRLSTRSPPSTTLLSALVQSCEELQPLSASPSPSPTRYARSENEEQPQE